MPEKSNPTGQPNLLDCALWAVRQGWYVLPVVGKEPMRPGGRFHLTWDHASNSGADVYEWFGPDGWPGFTGYAVVLKPSGLAVADVTRT